MCQRLRVALLTLGIVLSASSVRAQVVYSGRVYAARGHSWHQLRVIQVSNGKTTALTDSPRSHDWPRCSLDGRYIYFLSDSEDDDENFPQQIWRFDRSTGAENLVFQQPNLPSTTDPDYVKRAIWGLIGTSADGRAIFFDIGAGEVLKFDGTETPLATTKEATFAVLSPEARRIALIGQDGHLRVIDISGRLLKDLGQCDSPAWSSDGKQLACFSSDQSVRTIDIASGTTTNKIALPPEGAHWSFPTAIAWRPDGKSLLVGSDGADSSSTSRYDDYSLLDLQKHTWKYIDGGNSALWTPDGSQIIYTSPRDLGPLPGGRFKSSGATHREWVTQLKSADIETLQTRTLVGGLSYNQDPQWCQ
jgi:Tol biopolymer transport system component